MNLYRLCHYLYRRALKHFVQRLTRGWSDDELWSLDHSLAKLILPRLKRFRKGAHGYPGDLSSVEEWQTILDTMIVAFEFAASEDYFNIDPDASEKLHEGLKLFADYYESLWW